LGSIKEQEKQYYNGKPNGREPLWEMPKVAKCSIVADEVVVTKLSKRVPMKIETSEGLHKMRSKL
jgi:hypothetical protein